MSREFKYILVDKVPMPTTDIEMWGEWMETNDRIVKQENIGPFLVSTVFLGVDHGWDNEFAAPVVFETMVFGEEITADRFPSAQVKMFKEPVRMRQRIALDEATLFCRYSTWEDAEAGHKVIAASVRRKLMKLVV